VSEPARDRCHMAVVSRRAAPQRSTSGLGTGTNEREPPDHQTDRADVRHGRWPPTSQQAKAHSRHPYLRGQHEIAGGERPFLARAARKNRFRRDLRLDVAPRRLRRRFRTPSIGSIGSRWHVNRTKPSPVAADAGSARAQTRPRATHTIARAACQTSPFICSVSSERSARLQPSTRRC
jgi:hypothetical protein